MLAMDDVIRQLLEVQDKDERIATLQQMVDSVPAEKAQISEELQGAEDKLNNAKEGLQKIQSKINDLDSKIQACQARINQLNAKSVEVKKNDEYRAILDQIETIKKQISDHEDAQLELMEGTEGAKEAFDQAQKEKEQGDARIHAAQQDLDVRQKNCEEQVAKLKAERDEMVKSIPMDIRRLYERLSAQQRVGVPFRKGVVPIVDNCCAACHLTVPPDKRLKAQAGNGITTCGTCGAMLYVED